MEVNFNLIDQPWIRVVDRNGTLREVGLRELLEQAHDLRTLHDDSPLVIAAILRMVLALLHSIYDGPRDRREWHNQWQAKQFDMEKIEGYFIRWYNRFDLFDAAHPFYQTTEEIGRRNPISTLLPEAASGHNATLFDHQTEDDVQALTPSEAARSVLVAQYFSLGGGQSGIKGLNFRDATLSRGALFFVEGENLFQTLMFNLIPYQSNPLYASLGSAGTPAWEYDNPLIPERKVPNGLLDYMTWQSRRIKLIPSHESQAMVRGVFRSQGLYIDSGLELFDPAKLYQKQGKKLGLIVINPERALWRDSHTLFRLQDDAFRPPAVFDWLGLLVNRRILKRSETLRYVALGMSSDQAKVELYRSEYMPLSLGYLQDINLVHNLSNALSTAELVSSCLCQSVFLTSWLYLFPELQQSEFESSGKIIAKMVVGARDRSNDEAAKRIYKLYDSWGAGRRYWSQLELFFRRTMQAIPAEREGALDQWYAWLRTVAWNVFDEVSKGLGSDSRALKAIVRGREQLTRGLGHALKINA